MKFTQFNRICAYFDTQGQYKNGTFHPIEIACLSDNFSIHHKMKVYCQCKPTLEEEDKNAFLKFFHHGLSYSDEKENINWKQLQAAIAFVYYGSIEGEKNLIAVRTKEAQNLLDGLNFPNININELAGATHKNISWDKRLCAMHISRRSNLKCSRNNVIFMKNYMESKYVKREYL